MKRRTLLQLGLGAGLASALPMQLWAAPAATASPETPRLLVVFLRGAYDAANLLVPTSSSFYYESRPNIAIAKTAALPLDGDWGLAPALADSIHPLWLKSQAVFVPFAGTNDTSRSHFETQDHIELGQPDDVAGGNRDFRSGFMNRLAGVLGSGSRLEAMAFTDQVPLILRGKLPVANQALPRPRQACHQRGAGADDCRHVRRHAAGRHGQRRLRGARRGDALHVRRGR